MKGERRETVTGVKILYARANQTVPSCYRCNPFLDLLPASAFTRDAFLG